MQFQGHAPPCCAWAKNIIYEYTNHKAFKGTKTLRKQSASILGSQLYCTVHTVTTTSDVFWVGPVRSCLGFKEDNCLKSILTLSDSLISFMVPIIDTWLHNSHASIFSFSWWHHVTWIELRTCMSRFSTFTPAHLQQDTFKPVCATNCPIFCTTFCA